MMIVARKLTRTHTVVTPPLPDYVPGHSAFSAAGAEVLKRVTGSELFGASHTQPEPAGGVEPAVAARLGAAVAGTARAVATAHASPARYRDCS